MAKLVYVRDKHGGYWKPTGQPSERLMRYRAHRKQWLRFEIDCFERCKHHPPDVYETVAGLLYIGRPDGRTRKQIMQVMAFADVAEQRLFQAGDEMELRNVFDRLKNGES